MYLFFEDFSSLIILTNFILKMVENKYITEYDADRFVGEILSSIFSESE